MIVLDTHVLVWWVDGGSRLSARARRAIEAEMASAQGDLLVSSITAWEIAMLVARGRLVLSMDVDDWLETVSGIEAVRFVPVDNAVAVQSARLPGALHADPADRMITALARHYAVPLVSADERIHAYRHVKTIW